MNRNGVILRKIGERPIVDNSKYKKFTEDQELEVYNLYCSGEYSKTDLSNKFDCCISTISKAIENIRKKK